VLCSGSIRALGACGVGSIPTTQTKFILGGIMGKGAVWVTKEGVKILVKDMTNTHIQNVIKYLEGKFAEVDLPIIYYEVLEEGAKRNLLMCMERFNKLYVEEVFEGVKNKRLQSLCDDVICPGDWD
jgi:hypothetical protein